MISLTPSNLNHISERKHHLVGFGDLMFCNGYGIKFDCHECNDGLNRKTGVECRICGPKPEIKKRRR